MRASLPCWLILMSLASAACQTVRPVALDQLRAEHHRRVWVTKVDQSVVVLSAPRIVNDRLVGFVDDVYQVFAPEEVQRIVTRRPAGARTAALVATGAVGAVSLMFVLAGTGDYQHPCTFDTGKCDPAEIP